MDTIMNDDWLDICYDIFEDNDSELVEYYIETICGENGFKWSNDLRLYDKKKVEAFRWGAEWLLEYMRNNNRLPERTGSKYKSDENFIAWLIVGYEDECNDLKSWVVQMNRNRLLDELLA